MNYRPALFLRACRSRHGLLAIAVAGLFVLSACAPASGTAPAATAINTSTALTATQVQDGGQVSVAVTWNGPDSGPVFQVAMDTHSVDLDTLDLARLATLKTPAGELSPTGWDAPRGGHHRAGTLTFAATTAEGRPTIGAGPVELLIRDVAGVPERSFQWQP